MSSTFMGDKSLRTSASWFIWLSAGDYILKHTKKRSVHARSATEVQIQRERKLLVIQNGHLAACLVGPPALDHLDAAVAVQAGECFGIPSVRIATSTSGASSRLST